MQAGVQVAGAHWEVGHDLARMQPLAAAPAAAAAAASVRGMLGPAVAAAVLLQARVDARHHQDGPAGRGWHELATCRKV